jgi:glutathione synthase/RimK-type ligase-like ATP-grasp enzyme
MRAPALTRDVAFVTYRKAPSMTPDDALALPPLAERGLRARAVPWDDAGADWGAFDAVVVRSCWDYHLRAAEFAAWLDHLEAAGARVWNPVPVLRWNASKTYLAELRERGARTVPTEWVSRGAGVTLHEIRRRTEWDDLVVKPVVSASGHRTWRTRSAGRPEDEQRFAELLAASDALVQPFLPDVERDGEWSLVFFGGEFSHAVVKRPRPGDFRVQPEFGGTVTPVAAPASLVGEAAAMLRHAPGPLLYARVDGCVVGGALVLMELELLEPTLFFGADPRAPRRFAAALGRVLESPEGR